VPQIANRKESDLTVITTHVNADFDALASLLAAQKLYPQAQVVFPGSQEKNLRNFFIQSMVYLFNIVDVKKIDFSRIAKLVLVDTRRKDRIGKLAKILNREDLIIHTYDHHPMKPDDIRGQLEIHAETGATVTILSEIIKKKKIEISPDEATIMCLGIYEDTGSFTFPSTTQRDFLSAAFLLSKGANLNIVANMISREISPEQIGFLNDMIQAAIQYDINGVEITLTRLSLDRYLPDFAFLVHKMLKMEDIKAVFALALMENKIYLVARSRTTEVDVGEIVSQMGGGGHTYAAAATIKGKTLPQTEQKLLLVLHKTIQPKRRARHLMSTPPITIPETSSCKKARALLTRYNINALLVTDAEKGFQTLLGFITRQVIEKAIFHKLDQIPVHEYMTTEIASVSPEANLSEIQEKVIENKQRILPVTEGDRILGVITRTDLLNTLIQEAQAINGMPPDPMRESVGARTRFIVNFMRERLSKRIINFLKTIGEVAHEMGYGAYVIGGFVRDLFLYRPNEDIDIVIEGDGIRFAKRYAKLFTARVHSHKKFNTAVIIFRDGFKIDVASARLEHYQFPAALPDVEMSSIKLDLFRRDFTINTLAIQLNPGSFAKLIDFYSAQKDIKDRVVRVLHNLSFVEDPTRVFRAIRFEQRFGFTIGKLTESLIENAVKMDFFKRLSGRRVFSELRQILEEENPVRAVGRLQDYNLLKVIHPSIEYSKDLIDRLNAVKKVISWHDLLFLEESYIKWVIYFMALIRHLDRRTSQNICQRLELPPRLLKLLCNSRFESERCLPVLKKSKKLPNSELYRLLHGFRTELILYMMAMAETKSIKKYLSFYYTQLRSIKTTVNGKDLLKLGLKQGPAIRKTLDVVLSAKLNGEVKTRREELAFAAETISKSRNRA
jgi:tRNA nucleotidyltransferase (CCA-adding enzyme)